MKRSYFFIAGMVLMVFLVFGIYFPALSKYRSLKIQEEELDVKIQDLDSKIAKLTEERDLLKNDRDYLEKVIRQELGLVKPGEIVYKFITDEDQNPPVPTPPVLPPQVNVPKVPQAPAIPKVPSAPKTPSAPVPTVKKTNTNN